MKIPYKFSPRPYQKQFIEAMKSGKKRAVLNWSRRAGKDMTCFNYAVSEMCAKVMTVALVFPTKEQGIKAFWNNIENDGTKSLDHIPRPLIKRISNETLTIELINGSMFVLLGAKDPDSLRGANAKIYILSEFVYMLPEVMDVITPVLANNGGQLILQSTPKLDAPSGATFKAIYDGAISRPETEYASTVKATEFLDDESLELLRQQSIEKNGNDFFFRQEYLCDWGQSSPTSYYGHIISKMEKNDQIGIHPYNHSYDVFTSWDLGMSDSMGIIFFQVYNNHMWIIDSYKSNNISLQTYVKFVLSKPYNYGYHFFPHDVNVREMSDSRSRLSKIRHDLGLINSVMLPRESVQTGIERVISGLTKTYIHSPSCGSLIQDLKIYRRKFNSLTGDYLGADHGSASHYSDAIRYAYQSKAIYFKNDGEFLIHRHTNSEQSVADDWGVNTTFYRPQF